jgi:hypothetical protein
MKRMRKRMKKASAFAKATADRELRSEKAA